MSEKEQKISPEFDDLCERPQDQTAKKTQNSHSDNIVKSEILEAYSFNQPISYKRIRLGRALFCILIACVVSFYIGLVCGGI